MTIKNVIEERYIRRNATHPWGLAVSKELIRGYTHIHKFGANFDIGSATDPETIWTAGGLYPWSSLSTEQTLYCLSTSTSDTSTLTIEGLDDEYKVQTETITLTGTTAVSPTNKFLQVYRMAYNGGSSNVGTITARVTSASGTIVAQIDAGKSQTLMAVYTVPADHTAFLLCLDASVQKNKDAQIGFYQRPEGESFKIAHIAEVFERSYRYDFIIPIKFNEKTDLDFRAIEVASSATRVTANFDLILVDNNDLSS
jgi:hypothetical protein